MNTGIKFILKSGVPIVVMMTQQEADKTVGDWHRGESAARGVLRFGGVIPVEAGGGGWSVKIDEIAAVHTITMEAAQIHPVGITPGLSATVSGFPAPGGRLGTPFR